MEYFYFPIALDYRFLYSFYLDWYDSFNSELERNFNNLFDFQNPEKNFDFSQIPIQLCVTNNSLDRLEDYFRNNPQNRIQIFRENFRILEITNEDEYKAEHIDYNHSEFVLDYISTCRNRIPIFLTLNPEFYSDIQQKLQVESTEIMSLDKLFFILQMLDSISLDDVLNISQAQELLLIENIQHFQSVIQSWVESRQTKTISTIDVDLLLQLRNDNNGFSQVIKEFDLLTPSGTPIIWLHRLMGLNSCRITGLDILVQVCTYCYNNSETVFLLYDQDRELRQPDFLTILNQRLTDEFQIRIVGSRPIQSDRYINIEELTDVAINEINESEARIVFVFLPSPQQEIWINRHQTRIRHKLILGLGNAVNFYLEEIRRPSLEIQNLGLEWLIEFIQNPLGLYSKYIPNVLVFLFLAIKGQLDLLRPRTGILALPRNAQVLGFLEQIGHCYVKCATRRG